MSTFALLTLGLAISISYSSAVESTISITINGPPNQEVQAQWLNNITQLKQQVGEPSTTCSSDMRNGIWISVQTLASVDYNDYVYQSLLLWTPTMFIAPQSMMHDTYLYDYASNLYTVDKFLEDLNSRYGGIDGVLLWHSYPVS
jgi:hypothetical protein